MKFFGQAKDGVIDNLLRAYVSRPSNPHQKCTDFDPDRANAYIERSLKSASRFHYEEHLSECAACRKIRHYPRPVCDACYSMEVAWIEASGRGRVHTWTVAHHPFHPGFKEELPYIVAIVDLEEGVRMNAQMRGVTPGEMRIGLPVQVTFERTKEGLTLPAFVRAPVADPPR